MGVLNNRKEQPNANARILIVYDEAEGRVLLNKWLTEAGFYCQTALNGNEALEILGQQEFDALVCDLGPPVARDLELLEGVREICLRTTFVLVADAHKLRVDGTALKQGADSGLWTCLWKPLRREAVLEGVKRALIRRRIERILPVNRSQHTERGEDCVQQLRQALDEWLQEVKAAGNRLESEKPREDPKRIVKGISILFAGSLLILISLWSPFLVAFTLVSFTGLHFLFQVVCQKIVGRQFAGEYFQSVVEDYRLKLPSLRESLAGFSPSADSSRLRVMLKCDFLALTNLLKTSSINHRYSSEERFLILYFRWQFLSLPFRRFLRVGEKKTILRLTSVVQYFANVVGQRLSQFAVVKGTPDLRSEKGEEFATNSLTGLKDCSILEKHLYGEISRAKRCGTPFVLILLEPRRLRSVNVAFGDATAEDIVHAVARASAETICNSDIFCRIGRNEFAILLPRARRSSAEAVAEGIARKFEAYARSLALIIPVRIDYGIAVFPEDGKDATSLFQFANLGLCGASGA